MGALVHYRLVSQLTSGLTVGLYISSAAIAADIAPMPTKAIGSAVPVINAWTFSVTPYAWIPLLNGSATVKGRTINVDVGYSALWDIVQHSEIPKDLLTLVGSFEARNGRLSLFADVVYIKIALGASMTRSRGVDALNATIGASAGFKEEMFIAAAAAAYEVARWGSSRAPDSGTAIDVFSGVRGWWQKADTSSALLGTRNVGDLASNADGLDALPCSLC